MALNFNKVEIMNGIDAHLNMTSDMTTSYTNVIPTTWTSYTILDALFNGNLNGGNLNFTISQLDTILVKRREVGTQAWITVFSIPIHTGLDLSFIKIDRLCGIGTYEYALVPSLNGIEGQYTIVEVESTFEGTFLCDADNSFKFLGNLSYDSVQQVSSVGVFEPYGKKYPTIVTNSAIDYKTLSLNGLLASNSFYTNRVFNHDEDRLLLDNLMEVLAEHKPKIVKDSNGRVYMVTISGNKQIQYLQNSGMTVASVILPLIEIGDPTDQTDLTNNGFVTYG